MRQKQIKARRPSCFAEAAVSNPFSNAIVDCWLRLGVRPIARRLAAQRPIGRRDSLADFGHRCTAGMTREINLSLHKGCFSSRASLLNSSNKHTHAYFGSFASKFNKITERSNWTH